MPPYGFPQFLDVLIVQFHEFVEGLAFGFNGVCLDPYDISGGGYGNSGVGEHRLSPVAAPG